MILSFHSRKAKSTRRITDRFRSLIKSRQEALFRGDLSTYKQLQNKTDRIWQHLRSSNYTSKMERLCSTNSRKWWTSNNALMGRTMIRYANLPTDGDIELLPNAINNTFQRISADLTTLTLIKSRQQCFFPVSCHRPRCC